MNELEEGRKGGIACDLGSSGSNAMAPPMDDGMYMLGLLAFLSLAWSSCEYEDMAPVVATGGGATVDDVIGGSMFELGAEAPSFFRNTATSRSSLKKPFVY